MVVATKFLLSLLDSKSGFYPCRTRLIRRLGKRVSDVPILQLVDAGVQTNLVMLAPAAPCVDTPTTHLLALARLAANSILPTLQLALFSPLRYDTTHRDRLHHHTPSCHRTFRTHTRTAASRTMETLDTFDFATATFFYTMQQQHDDKPPSDSDSTSFDSLLLQADDDEIDCDLELALSIIHELDVSFIEPATFGGNNTSAHTTHTIDTINTFDTTDAFDHGNIVEWFDSVDATSSDLRSNDAFNTVDFFQHIQPASTATRAQTHAHIATTSPASPSRKEKRCTYQNRKVRIWQLCGGQYSK